MALELTTAAQQWANDVLVWVGFGTLAGLLAKAVMPGRDPGGAVATLAMGVGGTVIGCGTLMYISNGARVTPISPLGFVVATAGAFVLLSFNRLFGKRVFVDGGMRRGLRGPRYQKRREYQSTGIDDTL